MAATFTLSGISPVTSLPFRPSGVLFTVFESWSSLATPFEYTGSGKPRKSTTILRGCNRTPGCKQHARGSEATRRVLLHALNSLSSRAGYTGSSRGREPPSPSHMSSRSYPSSSSAAAPVWSPTRVVARRDRPNGPKHASPGQSEAPPRVGMHKKGRRSERAKQVPARPTPRTA